MAIVRVFGPKIPVFCAIFISGILGTPFPLKLNATDEGAFAPKALVCRNKMSKSRFAVIGG